MMFACPYIATCVEVISLLKNAYRCCSWYVSGNFCKNKIFGNCEDFVKLSIMNIFNIESLAYVNYPLLAIIVLCNVADVPLLSDSQKILQYFRRANVCGVR